jgi:hypothetical protein
MAVSLVAADQHWMRTAGATIDAGHTVVSGTDTDTFLPPSPPRQ